MVTDTRVSNWTERKYDADRDNYLQPAEAKRLLRDRYNEIKSEYKPVVTNSIESQYDLNKNGLLEKPEIADIAKDI